MEDDNHCKTLQYYYYISLCVLSDVINIWNVFQRWIWGWENKYIIICSMDELQDSTVNHNNFVHIYNIQFLTVF